jgi:hypothetical protein
MITEEEERQQLIESIERNRLIQSIKAKRAAPVEVEEEQISAANPRGLARAAGQGAFMGWGDEITGGLTAAMAKLGGDKTPFGEIYEDVRGLEEQGYDQYAEDNPVAAMGTEIATGLITDRFIPGGAGRQASRGKKLMRALARNAGEGAISGAGVADENRLAGAGIGAGVGTALGGALSGLGKVPAALTRRNIPTKLGNKPIHLVTEPDTAGVPGAIGNF